MKDKYFNKINELVNDISMADIEHLVWVRDFIINQLGFKWAMPLERIINTLEEIDKLKNKD